MHSTLHSILHSTFARPRHRTLDSTLHSTPHSTLHSTFARPRHRTPGQHPAQHPAAPLPDLATALWTAPSAAPRTAPCAAPRTAPCTAPLPDLFTALWTAPSAAPRTAPCAAPCQTSPQSSPPKTWPLRSKNPYSFQLSGEQRENMRQHEVKDIKSGKHSEEDNGSKQHRQRLKKLKQASPSPHVIVPDSM